MENLSNMVALASILAGITVFLIMWPILAPKFTHRRTDTSSELYKMQYEQMDTLGKYTQPILDEFMTNMPNVDMGDIRKQNLNKLIQKSGNPWKINADELVGLMIAFGIGGSIVGVFVSVLGIVPAHPALIILGFGVLAFLYPYSTYRSAREKRAEEMRKYLPEALDLLTVSLSSGLTFQPAIISVAAQLPDSIVKEEFQKIAANIGAGQTLAKALKTLSDSTESEEAESFVKAVIMSQKLGSDVTETLAQQAEFARSAKETRLQEKIARLNTTLFIPISLTMLPAFLIIFVAPILLGLLVGL